VQLIDVLDNYPALQDRIPMRHWRPDETEPVGSSSCGYCAKGRACAHDVVRAGALKPITSRRQETPIHRLSEMLADVDRQIDALPTRVRALFHLRYRVGLSVREVMAALGLRGQAAYYEAHGIHYEAMSIRLIDWFEREPEAVAA
jgi:hypothetical protein